MDKGRGGADNVEGFLYVLGFFEGSFGLFNANLIVFFKYIIKIPHTGDKASLD